MRLNENEWFIQAPWGRLCIVAWGNCINPPVLMLHGSGDSLASFRPLLQHLPTTFYYVGFELPGQGRSDHYPPGLSISLMDLAHCIEIIRRHFRWEQFIYLAHSVGGTIGRLYNLAYPGRFTRAIELEQITPSFGISIDKLPEWFQFYYESNDHIYNTNNTLKQNQSKYTWDQAIERVLNSRYELTPQLARATIERYSEPVGNGLIRFTFDPRWSRFRRPPMSREQIKTLFTSLPTPTLCIVAEESINRGLFRNTPFLLEDHGNNRVVKVKGGHDIHIAHPERVAPFVNQFLVYGLEGLDRKSKL